MPQRFAFYSTIPVFVIQVLLVTLGIMTLFSRPSARRGGHEDLEKVQGHPLRDVASAGTGQTRNVSFDKNTDASVTALH